MKLSTRNQLSGTVTGVKLGTIMSEITVDIGGQTVVAAITRGSAEELGLDDGAKLLQETLDQEEATDEALTEIAETVVNQEGQAEAA